MSEQFRNYGLNLAAAAVAAVNQLKTVELSEFKSGVWNRSGAAHGFLLAALAATRGNEHSRN